MFFDPTLHQDMQVPKILRPIADTLAQRAERVVGERSEDPLVFGTAHRLVVQETLGHIAFDNYLDQKSPEMRTNS